MDDGENLVLSREDLYELAWSKPMAELAKDFGISDVGLAKRCRRLGIPLPGRGYWARIDAGQTPYKPKLTERKEQYRDRKALKTAAPVVADVEPIVEADDAPASESGVPVPDRIAAITIEPIKAVADAVLAVKRTARLHKGGKASDLAFSRGERVGAVVDLNVTSEALERALLFADTVLRSAEALGWTFDDPKTHSTVQGRQSDEDEKPRAEPSNETEIGLPAGRLLIENEQIAFAIEERYKDEPRTPSAHELAREKREYATVHPGNRRWRPALCA